MHGYINKQLAVVKTALLGIGRKDWLVVLVTNE